MSNLYRGSSIDASYQFSVYLADASYQASVYLAKWFPRRRFLEINHSETRIACGGHVC
jgi:hypothetical protein